MAPDYIKFGVSYLSKEYVLSHPLIEWETITRFDNSLGDSVQNIKSATGYLSFPCERGGNIKTVLRVKVSPCFKSIDGSIHKAYNQIFRGLDYNANVYSYHDHCKMLETLERYYNIDLEGSSIENIEVGKNIPVPRFCNPLEKMIKGSFIMFRGNGYISSDRYPNDGYMRVFRMTDKVIIKVYDKGSQYSQGPILRIEVKISSNVVIKSKLGVKTLQDTLWPDRWQAWQEYLSELLDDMTIVDSVLSDDMTVKDAKRWSDAINPTWLNEVGKDKKYRERKQLVSLIEKYNRDQLEKYIHSQAAMVGPEYLNMQKRD